MPLEIRELVIKVNLEEKPVRGALNPKELQDLKTKIIRECVEKVLQQLENRTER